jgi:hypothetical protein
MFFVREPFITKGGLPISIQASGIHYCSPQQNYGPWKSVEISLRHVGPDYLRIFDKVPELLDYAEYKKDPEQNDVYCWVPIHVAVKLIEALGGLTDQDDVRFHDIYQPHRFPAPQTT